MERSEIQRVTVDSEPREGTKVYLQNPDEELEVGQWYWVKGQREDWLGCVIDIGSNYALLKEVGEADYQEGTRIHFDDFDEEVRRREWSPDSVISSRVAQAQHNVNSLLGQVKQLTSKLGLTPKGALSDQNESHNALVAAHGKDDIKAHKKALILAKETTLPELFEKIESEHREMAMWMKAQLIPMLAEAKHLKASTSVINDRIFTVELYAGLVEELQQIKKGEPAGIDEKIHVFQRRHYMDEECLANYKAGGMDFSGIQDFDKWLLKKENRDRILPLPKCVVAFKVRRETKRRNATSIGDFIRFSEMDKADKQTFLYIRNGGQYYRLTTEIEFGSELFPDASKAKLLSGGQLYIHNRSDKLLSEQEHNAYLEEKKEAFERFKERMVEWNKKSKAKRKKDSWFKPDKPNTADNYAPLTPDDIHYDDAMREISAARNAHNRVAVVFQGLLDRSPAFQPHPPWKIWTPEGFGLALELVYDNSRGLSEGEKPDFEAYRAKLNETLVKGSHTVGQHYAWMKEVQDKEYERQDNDYRIENPYVGDWWTPYGNPGPGMIAEVTSQSRDKSKCGFKWERRRERTKWVVNPDNPGYMKPDPSGINVNFKCSASKLMNVDAYKPGDFKIFFNDPRTRMEYLKWAPLLLSAEDWHAGKYVDPRED